MPDDVFSLFPVLGGMLRRRGGDLSGGQQQQLAIGRALVMRPRLLLLDEPTEGIQPSIIKDIGRAISYLRDLGQIAVVLVEQYLDFAHELGDHFVVMDRGAIVYSCGRDTMDEAALRRALALRSSARLDPALVDEQAGCGQLFATTDKAATFAANRAIGNIALAVR